MNYLDIKYRGKRKEENIMPIGINDAYAALLGGVTLTIDKERINNNFNKNSIKDVIFNNPATIVIWKDGTKTVVKCQDRDTYSEELGLAMCIVKKCCGNKGNYNDVFNKWLPKEGNSMEYRTNFDIKKDVEVEKELSVDKVVVPKGNKIIIGADKLAHHIMMCLIWLNVFIFI